MIEKIIIGVIGIFIGMLVSALLTVAKDED